MIPQQYSIDKAIIRSNRSELEVDILQNIIELNFHESIHKPYITGKLIIVDDMTIFETMDFRGTEEIELEVSIPGFEYVLNRKFIITAIEKTIQTNDKSNVLLLKLLDVHAFTDIRKKVSKSYTGQIEDIITQIVISELDMGIDLSYVQEHPSLQREIRVITPYLSPLQSCVWLKNRATTFNGSPFFLYCSLFDDNIRLGNFDNMMTRPIFNEKVPFTYTEAQANVHDDFHNYDNAFIVRNLKQQDDHNSYKLMQNMGLAADVVMPNIQNGTAVSNHYSARQQLNKLQQQEILPNTPQTVFDDMIDHDSDSIKSVSNILCSSTYNSYNNFHDAGDEAAVIANIQSSALVSMLENNKVDISIPGVSLYASNVAVGDRLRLHVIDTNVERENELDKKRSGDYLILGIRHIYLDTEFIANLTISKLNELEL